MGRHRRKSCTNLCIEGSPYRLDVLDIGGFDKSQEFVRLCARSASSETAVKVGTYSDINFIIG